MAGVRPGLFTDVIAELKRDRESLDAAISGLEVLNGDRVVEASVRPPAPERPAVDVTYLPKPRARRKPRAERSQPVPRRRPGGQPGNRMSELAASKAAANALLVRAAIKSLGGLAAPKDIRRETGLSRIALLSVRRAMLKRRELVLEWRGRSTCWSLPAKEVP